MGIYKTIHLNEVDANYINYILVEAQEFIYLSAEEGSKHHLVQELDDVFELLNK